MANPNHTQRVHGAPLPQDTTGRVVSVGLSTPPASRTGDGRMLLAEVKLGGAAIEEAARKLMRINNNMLDRSPRLVVITAVGRGYRRDDGVDVVPITALGP